MTKIDDYIRSKNLDILAYSKLHSINIDFNVILVKSIFT